MTAKKTHPQITQIGILICVICVICGTAYGQTNTDRWIDYVAGEYDIFPNVTYAKASNVELKLDLYLPKNRTRPNTTLILFHGGGWVDGQKERNVLFLLPYLEMGWSAVNVEYRNGHQAPAPAAVEDARCALRWLTYHAKDYSLDPSRFVRIHRSFVLNIDRIAKVELYAKDSRMAILRDGTRLPVSRAGYARLSQLL